MCDNLLFACCLNIQVCSSYAQPSHLTAAFGEGNMQPHTQKQDSLQVLSLGLKLRSNNYCTCTDNETRNIVNSTETVQNSSTV